MFVLREWHNIFEWKPLWKRITEFVLLVTIFCMTIEFCTRIEQVFKFDAPFWGEYSSSGLKSRGQNIPNARFEKWKNNSLGFRGPEITLNKQIGKCRVVCMGASETYGLYESANNEWPEQLRKLLPERYEVVNASVVGLPLNEYTSYMNKNVFPLAPDVVVLVVNPLFMIAKDITEKKEPDNSKSVQNLSIQESLKPTFRSLTKIKQVLKQSAANNSPTLLQWYQIWNLSNQIKKLEAKKPKNWMPFDTAPEDNLLKFRNDLEHVIEAVLSKNARVIICTYPYLISDETIKKYPEIMLDYRRFAINLTLNGIKDAFRKGNELISDTSREKNIILADIALKMPKNLEYFGDNVHYSDKGARLFAAEVASLVHHNLDK